MFLYVRESMVYSCAPPNPNPFTMCAKLQFVGFSVARGILAEGSLCLPSSFSLATLGGISRRKSEFVDPGVVVSGLLLPSQTRQVARIPPGEIRLHFWDFPPPSVSPRHCIKKFVEKTSSQKGIIVFGRTKMTF